MRRVPTSVVAVVGASFLARVVVGWLRATPVLFPDEYLYAALGRSFAESGGPHVRGEAVHFPALLQPLVSAPVWLIDDVGLAYRVLQLIGALAMSLAAVPVFLLARRLGLGSRLALALAALAALVPDLVYSSYVSSEAFAYPLVLAAVYAAARTVAAPTRRAQLAFVAVSSLAALSLIGVSARERRVKAALREHALSLTLFAAAGGTLAALALSRPLEVYRELLGFHAGPLGVAHWAALDAMTLAYAAGWVVVPGALLGLGLALSRPRSREELSFGVFTALLCAALLLEAGFLQASLPAGREIQERYVFYAVPLLGLCFALYAARGWPLRIPHLALAGALLLVSVRLPLSGYAVSGTVNGSPVLYAVHWLAGKLGSPGDAASVVAAAVGVMSALAVVASRRPRLATPVVLGLALLVTGAASAGAVAFEVSNAASQKHRFLPADPSWVDRLHVGRVPLLQASGGIRAASMQELFWNRSIDRVLLLPRAAPVDGFDQERVIVGPDGALRAGGKPLVGALVVDEYGSTVRLRGARLLEAGRTASLWTPAGRPRLSLYATGRYYDGWLGDRGTMRVWPATPDEGVSGWVSVRLTAPDDGDPATVTVTPAGGEPSSFLLRPGASRLVRVAACAPGVWRGSYRSSVHRIVDLRVVSVHASTPAFTPDRSACASPRSRPPSWKSLSGEG